MTAPLRHAPIASGEVFRARAEARAYLYAAGIYTLHEAIDVLQHDAETSGLVDRIGQDAVQQILADEFHHVRDQE